MWIACVVDTRHPGPEHGDVDMVFTRSAHAGAWCLLPLGLACAPGPACAGAAGRCSRTCTGGRISVRGEGCQSGIRGVPEGHQSGIRVRQEGCQRGATGAPEWDQ
eukprot:8104847-Pyramimonas_sp.AAC.1